MRKSAAPDDEPTLAKRYEDGLTLLAARSYFAAHEALEDAWRAAAAPERDFFQGLVHVAVAWYQAQRGNRVGCERQLAKARRRLSPYAPAHRDLDVAALLELLEAADGTLPALPALEVRRAREPGAG